MSADRLRAAADRLDWDASYLQPGDFLELQQERHAKTATAALLRAMADDLEIGLYIVGAESPAAAFALADVILGGDDE